MSLFDEQLIRKNGYSRQLIEKISVLIADILAACFTNLPRVIVSNCHCNSIEARKRSVRPAGHLLDTTPLPYLTQKCPIECQTVQSLVFSFHNNPQKKTTENSLNGKKSIYHLS
ncbi:hypothetical protein K7X08_013114 [Anisodus acutangulus]|uniref:Uncharacterized protein n=1 Tax=Anisodus acutangulus TaxID=402998 RepID=A0A9Q1RGB2_9SOLA|nr:hypothetical protein K7X08_013114 [Anisodus acutangulus]